MALFFNCISCVIM